MRSWHMACGVVASVGCAGKLHCCMLHAYVRVTSTRASALEDTDGDGVPDHHDLCPDKCSGLEGSSGASLPRAPGTCSATDPLQSAQVVGSPPA